MKKGLKRVGIGLSVFLLVGVIIIGGYYLMQKIEHDQMVSIVKSEEVKQIIETDLKAFDKNALTGNGKIKSYKIDEESIKHNPMGGISFTIYINNDTDLYIFYTVNKDSQTNKLVNEGGGNSGEFEKLITEENNE